MKKYNIGLDIGTTSVGWAVVEDSTQKVIKKGKGKNRKALWGVRTFEEASTAEARRNFRSSRRRYDRRRNRVKLLQEEFKQEINKVDPNFFQKLKESKYHEKDILNKKTALTKEEKQQIKEYNNKYKTIYHLRDRLINDTSKEDIRLVYLGIHHIIKYRGNFLYDTNFNISNLDIKEKIINVLDSFVNLTSYMDIPENYLEIIDINEMEKIFVEKSKNDIKVNLKNTLENISNNKKFAQQFTNSMLGYKFSIKNLFMLEEVEKDISISFDGTDFEDKYSELERILDDKIETLTLLKELYDTIFLKKIFKGSNSNSLSGLMIEKYNKHKQDLRYLKDLFKNDRSIYNKIFKTKKELCLYDKYIHNNLSYEEFRKELDKYLIKIFETNINQDLIDIYELTIKERISNGEFLPRITDSENGKYPYQLNKDELIKIIENQGNYYPFLKEKIGDDYKLVKLLEFKIPYYVGPLVSDKQSDFAWMERKIDNVRITPYNFDEVVDKEKTAEKFIKRMISHCTYLLNEYALPNNSILYSRYKVMNELKQIKVNGEKLTNELQHKIMEELFLKTNGSITDKKFKQYLYSLSDFSMYGNDINVTGYSSDDKFANTMQSYYDFFGENGIFDGTSYNEENADEIIEWITIFDDYEILKNKVINKYSELNESQVNKILSKKYSGWGSLSKELLITRYYKDKKTNIHKSILDLMYETSENFMQIINNDEYKFQDMIKERNKLKDDTKLSYELVENLATSPANKKGIYQALKVVDEIIKYMGYEPENIVIEMARSEEIKKSRKDDRKKYLINLYENNKIEIENYNKIISELNDYEKIDSEKLFLYFIQEGKCLYSGRPLNIEDLKEYEVDHIIPKTLIKDDSIDNKALVYRVCNQAKAASFVLPYEYRTKQRIEWWRHLKKIGLMSAKKFHNLTRTEYKDEDIQGFINRQLVETRQITKHVANIISNLHQRTNVIYLKANLSHNYRERYELFKFRSLNDYHHAHDAYLAAVLGEYKEKYMKKEINFEMVKELNQKFREIKEYKKLKYGYVINSLDENASEIVNKISKNLINETTGEILFDAKKFNDTVENTLYRNDVLISRKTEIRSGQLYKQTIYPAKIGNVMIKKDMPTDLYGGYSNVETSYLVLIEYNNKKKMIGIPLEIFIKAKNNGKLLNEFIIEQLNLKETDEFKILKNIIPYETLINYKNQNVYIKGYSIANKNCELSNANQLKISKDNMKKWKYVLNKIINNVPIPKKDDTPIIDESEMLIQSKEILVYLCEQKDKYPLFANNIEKIKETINIDSLNFDELSKLIIEILKIYNCSSINGNLKEFGLGDRIGRLSGNSITTGTLKFQSITGLKETEYEF